MSVRPKKGLGQHFLAEPSVVRRIVDAVQAPPGAQVSVVRSGEDVTARVTARVPGPGGALAVLPGLRLSAEAVAAAEEVP